MDYRYQIAIKTWQQNQYGSGWYQNTCQTDLKFPHDENMKQFIERYGNTESAVIFLEELLNAAYPRQSPEQESSLNSLTNEQLMQKVNQLLESQYVLQLAKQGLEKEVSTLSRTKENRDVEKLKEEKANLKREKDQLNQDNKRFESQIANLQKNLDRVEQKLSSQQNQNIHYHQEYQEYQQKYNDLAHKWNKLVADYDALQKQLAGHHTIEQENQKLKKSRQTIEHRVQEIEQELQETQQKLTLATMRLRGINTHSDHAGGGSRSDQLKNEFSHLKMGLFHDASSKVLNGWRDQGSSLTFRSEEFFKIKSILSQQVFGDGMAYFAKDKTAVDTELNLLMEALASIKDFSPTTAIFQEIQERVQYGLLRAKGVDHSDEAIKKFIEEITQRIDQELKLIADLETLAEALSEIKKFVEAGLKIVREIVNDTNSGELFIPENGTPFDKNAHDTRDDHQGQVKMTVCAGYRIKGTVLVKADVMTYEPEPTSPDNEPEPVNSQNPNPQNLQSEGEMQENNSPNIQKVEEGKETTDLIVGQDDSVFVQPRSSDSSQEHSEGTHKNLDPNEPEKSSVIFMGKVTSTSGVCLRSRPNNRYRTKIVKPHNAVLAFEAWVVVELSDDIPDNRWYKLAKEDYWVPAHYIDADPPSDMPPMEYSGGDDEAR